MINLILEYSAGVVISCDVIAEQSQEYSSFNWLSKKRKKNDALSEIISVKIILVSATILLYCSSPLLYFILKIMFDYEIEYFSRILLRMGQKVTFSRYLHRPCKRKYGKYEATESSNMQKPDAVRKTNFNQPYFKASIYI